MNKDDTALSIFYGIGSVFVLGFQGERLMYRKTYLENVSLPGQVKLYPETNPNFSFESVLNEEKFDKALLCYGGLPHDENFQFQIPDSINSINQKFNITSLENAVYQKILFDFAQHHSSSLILAKRNNVLYFVALENGNLKFSNQFFVQKGIDIVYYLEMIFNQYPETKGPFICAGDFEIDEPLTSKLKEIYPEMRLASVLTNSELESSLKPFLPELFHLHENN